MRWRWPQALALLEGNDAWKTRNRIEKLNEELDAGIDPAIGRWLADSDTKPQSVSAAMKAATDLEEASEMLGWPSNAEAAAAALGARLTIGPVAILCDYDVDGGCSAAIMKDGIKILKPDAEVQINTADRDTEGFGPNRRCLDEALEAGARTILVLDCGTEKGELLDEYAERGLCPIVIDHHPPRGSKTPERGLLVNPWADDDTEHRTLCTGGLTWWIARGCIRQAEIGKAESAPMRRRITALAALATACDAMSVDPATTGGRFNRALIMNGLRAMRGAGVGLSAVLDHARVNPAHVQPSDLTWRIGPRINAGSRSGASGLAAECLSSDTQEQARACAGELSHRNRARRLTCNEATGRALEAIAKAGEPQAANIVWDPDVNPGNAGVVAGKILDKHPEKPAIVMGQHETGGPWRGSGRSNGTDLGEAVALGVKNGWIGAGGGHKLACGLTVDEHGRERAHQELQKTLAWETPSARKGRTIDIALGSAGMTVEAIDNLKSKLDALEPYGVGWPNPTIAVRAAVITNVLERSASTAGAILEMKARCGEVEFEGAWIDAPNDWTEMLKGDATLEERYGKRVWKGESRTFAIRIDISGPPAQRVIRIVELEAR